MLKDPGSSPGRWCMWSWNKGAIPHLVVHIDFESGRDYTFGGAYGFGVAVKFDFDKFILISNLQTMDVSFMPRVAVWISLHTC